MKMQGRAMGCRTCRAQKRKTWKSEGRKEENRWKCGRRADMMDQRMTGQRALQGQPVIKRLLSVEHMLGRVARM